MIKVTGIRFRPASKIYYFDPDGLDLEEGQGVIVETARGLEYGKVAISEKMVKENEIVSPLRKVKRIATEEDHKQLKINEKKEKEA